MDATDYLTSQPYVISVSFPAWEQYERYKKIANNLMAQHQWLDGFVSTKTPARWMDIPDDNFLFLQTHVLVATKKEAQDIAQKMSIGLFEGLPEEPYKIWIGEFFTEIIRKAQPIERHNLHQIAQDLLDEAIMSTGNEHIEATINDNVGFLFQITGTIEKQYASASKLNTLWKKNTKVSCNRIVQNALCVIDNQQQQEIHLREVAGKKNSKNQPKI